MAVCRHRHLSFVCMYPTCTKNHVSRAKKNYKKSTYLALETQTCLGSLLLLLPLFRCVEVVTWPFVVIAICPSCACTLLVQKTMLVKQKKITKNQLTWPSRRRHVSGPYCCCCRRFDVLRWRRGHLSSSPFVLHTHVAYS